MARQVACVSMNQMTCHVQLGCNHRSLAPRGGRLGSKLVMGGGGDQVTAGGEGFGDGGVRSEETLGGQQSLNVAQAKGEAQIEPDRVLDDGLREPESAI